MFLIKFNFYACCNRKIFININKYKIRINKKYEFF